MNTMTKFFAGFVVIALLFSPITLAAGDPVPILIGATVSETGRYAEPSAMGSKGIRLWARQVNARGTPGPAGQTDPLQ